MTRTGGDVHGPLDGEWRRSTAHTVGTKGWSLGGGAAGPVAQTLIEGAGGLLGAEVQQALGGRGEEDGVAGQHGGVRAVAEEAPACAEGPEHGGGTAREIP